MTSFLKTARVRDEESSVWGTVIETDYVKYIPGYGYEHFTDTFDSKPLGLWHEIRPISDSLVYEQFLNTMIEKTTEIRRKMVLVALENILCENKNIWSLIRTMNTLKILDPTFIPPIVNTRCAWQKRLIMVMCKETMPEVIESCKNDYRLEKVFKILKLIEADL